MINENLTSNSVSTPSLPHNKHRKRSQSILITQKMIDKAKEKYLSNVKPVIQKREADNPIQSQQATTALKTS